MALTDHGEVAGINSFYNEFTKAGLKLGMGVEAYQAPFGANIKGCPDSIKDNIIESITEMYRGNFEAFHSDMIAFTDGLNKNTKTYEQKNEFIKEIIDFTGRTKTCKTPKKTVISLFTDFFTYMHGYNKSHHICLYAKDNDALRKIYQMHSLSNEVGFYHTPRFEYSFFGNDGGRGIIATSACLGGKIAKFLMLGKMDDALEATEEYRAFFEDFYLEIQPHDTDEQRLVNKGVIEISKMTGIPIVATADVHYPTKRYAKTQEIMLGLKRGKTFKDTDRFIMEHSYWFKTEKEMISEFSRYHEEMYSADKDMIHEAMDNTEKVLNDCSFDIGNKDLFLPSIDINEREFTDIYNAYEMSVFKEYLEIGNE